MPNYQGREVLYYVLAAPLMALIQHGVLALRLTSALLNLLTVGLTIALGRAMFPGKRGVVIALAAGVMLALSFPQIWLARQAFRAVTLPCLQALTLVLLWRGLTVRRRAWAWLLVAGIAAGATLYTYMAARLFPLWLALGGVALLILDHGNRRHRLRQGAIFCGALLISAVPIGLYALDHPDIFLGRLAEVTTYGTPGTDLGQSILLHLKMFFIEGDPLLRYNVPGRPYFTLPEGLLLLVGIVAIVRRLRRREGRAHRARGLCAGPALAADGDPRRDRDRRPAAQSHAHPGHGPVDLPPGRDRLRGGMALAGHASAAPGYGARAGRTGGGRRADRRAAGRRAVLRLGAPAGTLLPDGRGHRRRRDLAAHRQPGPESRRTS